MPQGRTVQQFVPTTRKSLAADGRVVGTKTFHVPDLESIRMVVPVRGVVSPAMLCVSLSQIQINRPRLQAVSPVRSGGAMAGASVLKRST